MIPSALDHVVVNVSDMRRACDFYARVLGADIVEFGAGRKAVRIGGQKLNLHDAATKGDPIARDPSVGGADLCILTETPMDDVVRHLEAQSAETSSARWSGPVRRGRFFLSTCAIPTAA